LVWLGWKPYGDRDEFCAVAGVEPGNRPVDVCDTTYGTPIEAPSNVANIRGRPVIRGSPHGNIIVFVFPATGTLPLLDGVRQAPQVDQSDRFKMTSCTELADYEWLTGPQAAECLRELSGRNEPLHAAVARLRRFFSPTRAHLLLEQVELRKRAAAKFERPDRLFFNRRGLEQATDEWVAAYKARRFTGRGPVADLCCGIGGDLVSLADYGSPLGVDRDPIAICLARANVFAFHRRATVEVVDVDRFDAGRFAAWHLDPDRRPQGNRTTALDGSSPGTATIARLLAETPHAAIKLAPAAHVPPAWREQSELEWISRDRECRQLVAWHGALAANPGQRKATVLTADGTALSFVGAANCELQHAKLDQYLFEPDAAVLAAHLSGAIAQEYGLSAVSAGIAYLTGPHPIDSRFVACFSVDEVLPLDVRKIGDALRERRVGRLEIKKRGVDHDPRRVRKQLRLDGDNEATLLLTRLGGKRAAIMARRVMTGNSLPSLFPAS
jgi:hypothetical protein